jgi:predicted TIM-barrel fold metal-dependent hydrolase
MSITETHRVPLPKAITDLKIIDTDTHLTEPPDLWSSRAPAGYEDRLPHVKVVDGVKSWIFDGQVIGRAAGGSVVLRDGSKARGSRVGGRGGVNHFDFEYEDVADAAYQVPARVDFLNKSGIYAQIIYPNLVGFGGQRMAETTDEKLRIMCAHIYNDAMVEIQEESGGRLLPMALVPWWDMKETVKEVERVNSLGLKGLNLSQDVHSQGLPDLGDRYWDPFWETAADLDLSVNFHIGSSTQSRDFVFSAPWRSVPESRRDVITAAVAFLTNGRTLANLIISGVCERHPRIKIVSVESGVGWLPFFLDSIDWHVTDTDLTWSDDFSMMPSEYFRRNIYSTFWFESTGLAQHIDALGASHCMFETDFPHPTSLYPDALNIVQSQLETLEPSVLEQVLSRTAAHVYNIDLGAGS